MTGVRNLLRNFIKLRCMWANPASRQTPPPCNSCLLGNGWQGVACGRGVGRVRSQCPHGRMTG